VNGEAQISLNQHMIWRLTAVAARRSLAAGGFAVRGGRLAFTRVNGAGGTPQDWRARQRLALWMADLRETGQGASPKRRPGHEFGRRNKG
jgi:hypothetical protein